MRHWIALEGVFSESRSAELARVKIARGTVDNVGVVVEAWCWRFVICVPRPQAAAQSQTELRDLGSLSVHPIVSHTPGVYPIGLLQYFRASIFHILPYLGGDEGSTRLVSGVCGGCVSVSVCVCVWVARGTRGGKVISHLLLLQYQGEIIMYSKGAIPISNTMGMQRELIDDRCFHHIFIHDDWLGFLSIPSASV